MKNKGFTLGDTIIEGVLIMLEDGTTKVIKADKPIIYKTDEENNK